MKNYDKHYSIENYYKIKNKIKTEISPQEKSFLDKRQKKKKNYKLRNKWLWTRIKGKNTSPLEERLKQAFIRKNLYPIQQYKPIENRNYKVDFCFPEEKLIIECDGNTYHGNQGTLWKRDDYEGRRHFLIKKAGYKILRYTTDDIQHNSDSIASHIKHLIKIIHLNEISKPNELNISMPPPLSEADKKTWVHSIGNGLQTTKTQTPGEFHGCLPVDTMKAYPGRESNRTTRRTTIATGENSSFIHQVCSHRLDGTANLFKVKSDQEIADYKNQLCEARQKKTDKVLAVDLEINGRRQSSSVVISGAQRNVKMATSNEKTNKF